MLNKITSLLHIVSGVLFIIAALIGKNKVFIPIGLCAIVLGFINMKKDK